MGYFNNGLTNVLTIYKHLIRVYKFILYANFNHGLLKYIFIVSLT